MPVLWTYGVDTGRLTLNEFVAVTSTNIAKILNMYPRKGAIVPGADADIVVWDPKAKKTISAKTQQSVIDYNVFEGIEGDRPAALHAVARRGRVPRRAGCRPSSAAAGSSSASRSPADARALTRRRSSPPPPRGRALKDIRLTDRASRRFHRPLRTASARRRSATR